MFHSSFAISLANLVNKISRNFPEKMLVSCVENKGKLGGFTKMGDCCIINDSVDESMQKNVVIYKVNERIDALFLKFIDVLS